MKFTFHYGEIKTNYDTIINASKRDLHSIMVRLKRSYQPQPITCWLYLHSIMVRLKPLLTPACKLCQWKFTFHYGEIKTESVSGSESGSERFTFHYGEIKTSVNGVPIVDVDYDLHSIMVRLKRIAPFQYQLRYFNLHSIMVRLKREHCKNAYTSPQIYIPLWWD